MGLLAALPLFAGRGTIQDLFFILTMLTLAQLWNLLAGDGGLVSIGQQAFVGIGAYALFGGAILWGLDPVAGIALGGLAALVLAVPTAFFAFRLQGAYFAIGTWVIAEVVRLSVAQWKAVGGGTGTSLPRDARDMWGTGAIEALLDVRSAAAQDILAYWLALALAVAVIGGVYALLRSRRRAWRWRRCATTSTLRARWAWTPGASAGRCSWRPRRAPASTGALIFLQTARISPDAAFSVLDWTAYVIFIVVIGGIGTIEGPILGVLVLFALQSTLADFGAWYLIALGLIAVAVMLVAPRGLWGLVEDRTGVQLFPIRRRLSGPDIRE